MYDLVGKPFWYYTFSYETTQLVVPATSVVQADIVGVFCQSALTEYIRYLISQNAAIDAAQQRTFFPSTRYGPEMDVGVIAGLAIWAVPTDIKTQGHSFTNTSDKPVWVRVGYETPLISLTLVPGAGYTFVYDLTVVNDSVTVESLTNNNLGYFNNPAGSAGNQAITFVNSLTGIGGVLPYKVLPGKSIVVETTLSIVPLGIANASNSIAVFGPWINLFPSPAEV